jgi:hypothetical protein
MQSGHSLISARCAVSNLAQSNVGNSVTSTSGRNSKVETTYGGVLIHKLVSNLRVSHTLAALPNFVTFYRSLAPKM